MSGKKLDEKRNETKRKNKISEQAPTQTIQLIFSDVWETGKKLVWRALADGKLLETRGDRYVQGDYQIVVEGVTE